MREDLNLIVVFSLSLSLSLLFLIAVLVRMSSPMHIYDTFIIVCIHIISPITYILPTFTLTQNHNHQTKNYYYYDDGEVAKHFAPSILGGSHNVQNPQQQI